LETVNEILEKLQQAARVPPFRNVDVLDQTASILKIRLVVSPDIYVQMRRWLGVRATLFI